MRPLCFVALRQPWPVLVLVLVLVLVPDSDQAAPSMRTDPAPGRPRQKRSTIPACLRMPFAVWRDSTVVGTGKACPVMGLFHTS